MVTKKKNMATEDEWEKLRHHTVEPPIGQIFFGYDRCFHRMTDARTFIGIEHEFYSTEPLPL